MKGRRTILSKSQKKPTGSLPPSEPVFLTVGFIRRPHGVKGELLMRVMTDFPERLRVGKEVFVGEDHIPYRIAHVRWSDRQMLISFEGLIDRDQAALLRNQVVSVRSEDLPKLEEDEYYFHQLLGLNVLDDETGQLLGILEEILETGANDVYVVRSQDGQEILLPAIDDVIVRIDVIRGEIRVRLLPWE